MRIVIDIPDEFSEKAEKAEQKLIAVVSAWPRATTGEVVTIALEPPTADRLLRTLVEGGPVNLTVVHNQAQ